MENIRQSNQTATLISVKIIRQFIQTATLQPAKINRQFTTATDTSKKYYKKNKQNDTNHNDTKNYFVFWGFGKTVIWVF